MTRSQFLHERAYLFWGVRDLDRLSDEAMVTGVLNGGDMDDVRALMQCFGRTRVANIFRTQAQRARSNYDPRIAHYFMLYFGKYAP